MGFFDDILIAHERLKDPSRLYPFCFSGTCSFSGFSLLLGSNWLCHRNIMCDFN